MEYIDKIVTWLHASDIVAKVTTHLAAFFLYKILGTHWKIILCFTKYKLNQVLKNKILRNMRRILKRKQNCKTQFINTIINEIIMKKQRLSEIRQVDGRYQLLNILKKIDVTARFFD